MTNWRNMPGPGDPETWGPCTNHPNDPRTPDDTGRFEEVRERMTDERVADLKWYREALAEIEEDKVAKIRSLAGEGKYKEMAVAMRDAIREYLTPTENEVQEQIEMEDEPDDRV